MKTPRVQDFDPTAKIPPLGSPMDHLPSIQKPMEHQITSKLANQQVSLLVKKQTSKEVYQQTHKPAKKQGSLLLYQQTSKEVSCLKSLEVI